MLGVGPMSAPPVLQGLQRWQPPVDARPWAIKGWRIRHSLDIAAQQRVPCALAIGGHLHVHEQCLIEGDVEVRNRLHLGHGCQVNGNLRSKGDMSIDPGCRIQGLLMTEGRLHLSPGVVIGSAQEPVNVFADVIDIVGPVLIHGRVDARTVGAVALVWPGASHPQ